MALTTHEQTALQAKFEQLAITQNSSVNKRKDSKGRFRSPPVKSPFNIEESPVAEAVE